MPTPITHFVAGAAMSTLAPDNPRPLRTAMAFGLAGVLPDIDLMSFVFGLPYSHTFGHRGFAHSLAFAMIIGLVVAALLGTHHRGRRAWWLTAAAAFAATASHGLLDMATNGGLGVGLLMPFDGGRYFWPLRPIVVSPFRPNSFIEVVVPIAVSELLWVWLPAGVFIAAVRAVRGLSGRHSAATEARVPGP